MLSYKILIVEDEKDLVNVLKYGLEKDGYYVISASNGESGLDLFEKERPDLVLLDIMLPKLDGFEFCRIVRKDSRVPIIMLTAKTDEVDRVLGLELGADDYVTKPFSVREVLARVKAILRRTTHLEPENSLIRVGALEVDLERYMVSIGGHLAKLSSREFEFLKCLLLANGKAMSRDALLEKVIGFDRSMNIDNRSVDQNIKRLRDKLKKESSRILTVKNIGYRFQMD